MSDGWLASNGCGKIVPGGGSMNKKSLCGSRVLTSFRRSVVLILAATVAVGLSGRFANAQALPDIALEDLKFPPPVPLTDGPPESV